MRALIGSVKQNIDDGNFDVSHKGTEEMISDAYTNPVGGESYKKFRSFVMGHAERLIRTVNMMRQYLTKTFSTHSSLNTLYKNRSIITTAAFKIAMC